MIDLKIVFKSKQELREAVWAYMEENDLITFPRPSYEVLDQRLWFN